MKNIKRGYISIEMIIIAALIICFGGLAVKNFVFGGSDVQDKETTAFVDTTKAVYEAVGHIPPPNIGGGSSSGGNLSDKGLKPNDIITIEGRKYVVLNDAGGNKYLIMDIDAVGYKTYNPKGLHIYEGSNIDSYLNNQYYNSFSQKLRDAIIQRDIQQSFYKETWYNTNYNWVGSGHFLNPGNCTGWCYKDNGIWISWDKHTPIKGQPGSYKFENQGTRHSNGYQSNIIQRKIYLPSVEEISKVVNVNDEFEVEMFLRKSDNKTPVQMWFRDGRFEGSEVMIASYGRRSLVSISTDANWILVRPTFVVDLNKIDFTKENKVLIPPYSPEQNQVKYEVHHYWQNITDDNYTLHEKMVYRGNPNTKVVTEQLKKEYEGFNYKNAKVNNDVTTETTIKPDGTTIINMYYDRKQCYFDLNGYLDGAWVSSIDNFGTASIKINNITVALNVSDLYKTYKYGSTYEVYDIKALPGHIYTGTYNSTLKGVIGGESQYHDNTYTDVNLRFDTIK